MVAFCAYFATFAVFFFTALYLEEVVGDSGYRIALVFLPMTVLMIAASLLAGRWAWILFASQVAIVPAPVISPLTLLAITAVLLLANAIAAIPARSAARTQPAVTLRTE